ncbi:MAG: hypothetical protein ACLQBB_11580 [Solirubrobacteraceae bacterium]
MPIASRPLRLHRPAALLAALAALVLLMLLVPAGAPARSAHAKRSSCPAKTATAARHARHAAPRHACTRRQTRKTPRRQASHKAHEPATPAVTLAPASCEDGSLPSRSAGGAFACEDGSEPSCEDGSTPTRSAAGAPMCVVPAEASEAQVGCAQEGGGECPTVEWACQSDQEAGGSGSQCQPGGSEEAGQEAEPDRRAQPPQSLSGAPASRS